MRIALHSLFGNSILNLFSACLHELNMHWRIFPPLLMKVGIPVKSLLSMLFPFVFPCSNWSMKTSSDLCRWSVCEYGPGACVCTVYIDVCVFMYVSTYVCMHAWCVCVCVCVPMVGVWRDLALAVQDSNPWVKVLISKPVSVAWCWSSSLREHHEANGWYVLIMKWLTGGECRDDWLVCSWCADLLGVLTLVTPSNPCRTHVQGERLCLLTPLVIGIKQIYWQRFWEGGVVYTWTSNHLWL